MVIFCEDKKKVNSKDLDMRTLEEEDSDTGVEVSVQTVTNLSLSLRGNRRKKSSYWKYGARPASHLCMRPPSMGECKSPK